jgi:histidinol dehydrogenase
MISMDFFSQIEHDPDSAAVLVTTSSKLAQEVCDAINEDARFLPRKEILESSLERHSHVLIASSLEEAIRFVNDYAAEHLQIITTDPFSMLHKIKRGLSFSASPVPVGDYASGTNHVLPTADVRGCFRTLHR